MMVGDHPIEIKQNAPINVPANSCAGGGARKPFPDGRARAYADSVARRRIAHVCAQGPGTAGPCEMAMAVVRHGQVPPRRPRGARARGQGGKGRGGAIRRDVSYRLWCQGRKSVAAPAPRARRRAARGRSAAPPAPSAAPAAPASAFAASRVGGAAVAAAALADVPLELRRPPQEQPADRLRAEGHNMGGGFGLWVWVGLDGCGVGAKGDGRGRGRQRPQAVRREGRGIGQQRREGKGAPAARRPARRPPR